MRGHSPMNRPASKLQSFKAHYNCETRHSKRASYSPIIDWVVSKPAVGQRGGHQPATMSKYSQSNYGQLHLLSDQTVEFSFLVPLTDDLNDKRGIHRSERVDGKARVSARVFESDARHLQFPPSLASVVSNLSAILFNQLSVLKNLIFFLLLWEGQRGAERESTDDCHMTRSHWDLS